jgi:predicted Zn-dependent peptidase
MKSSRTRTPSPIHKKTVFPNGLTLLTESHSGFQTLSVGAWVDRGSRHEEPHEHGVSHFLEHMLFKGTRSRSAIDIARAVDRVGGEFNAFTSRDQTCFHITLLNRDHALAGDILSDVVLDSAFAEGEFERERRVILQEIAMIDESPEELVHDLYFEKVFAAHPLGRTILGTEQGIGRLKRDTVLGYFNRHYRPENMVVTVAGDISHEQARKALAPLGRAGVWPGREARPSRGASFKRPKWHPGVWWETRASAEQVHLVWGVQGPVNDARERFAAFLLNVHLGGGMSSSLFQEIREKNGLAYTVYSSLSPFEDAGVFSVYAATGMELVPLCLELIRANARKLTQDLLTRDEFEMIRDNLKSTILLSADSMESRMTSLARNHLVFGRHVPVADVIREVDLVRPEDVRQIARKLFRDEKSQAVLMMGPKPTAKIRKWLSAIQSP